MKGLLGSYVAGIIALAAFSGTALAGKPIDQTSKDKRAHGRAVFVTGSLIPQRIQLKRIGTTTVSPLRIIDRREIDQTGRQTAPGILIADPAVRGAGH